jgi:hypothetical protein
LVAEVQQRAPEIQVLPIDLPGRRSKPGDLTRLTIADWVDSVVADIDTAGLDDVVIVGHSVAGLTVPGVVTRLGAPRVRELILATVFVPPQGAALVDTLPGPGTLFARRAAKKGTPGNLPRLPCA